MKFIAFLLSLFQVSVLFAEPLLDRPFQLTLCSQQAIDAIRAGMTFDMLHPKNLTLIPFINLGTQGRYDFIY